MFSALKQQQKWLYSIIDFIFFLFILMVNVFSY